MEAEAIFIVSTSVAAIIVNSIDIVYLKRKKRNGFEDLLFSLAISDFTVGLSSMILTIVIHEWKDELHKSFKQVKTVFYLVLLFSYFSSMLHVLLIAVDRFIAVKFPIWHMLKRKRKWTQRIIVLMTWGIPVPLCLLRLLVARRYLFALNAYISIVICIAILLLYAVIIKTAFHRGASVASQNDGPRLVQRQKQLILTFSSILIFFLFCVSTFPAMMCVNREACDETLTWNFILFLSVMNPLAYFFTSLLKYCFRICRPQELSGSRGTVGQITTPV